ncbi:MAG TPA: hypothetical protein VNJ03_04340 [Vicinamibacterales bacterium]|nr:hypothetical protein [Vicinamibacterales bacterium]
MRIRIVTAALVVLPAILVAQSPMRVATVKFSQPAKVAELDIDKLKGQPSRLAWSADGTQVYLQTLEGRFGQADAKLRHYSVTLADGARQDMPAEPAWASAYWTDKSAQTSPDNPAFKIDVKTETRTAKTVSAPMGGEMARGGSSGGDDTTTGGGTSSGDAMAAAYNNQPVPVNMMMVGGATIGEFVNSVIVPGMTFGWGPRGTKVIAFAEPKNGRITIMDTQGEKREVQGSKNAILPAWSPDGTRIAWLQKDGKKKFTLQVARVESGS